VLAAALRSMGEARKSDLRIAEAIVSGDCLFATR